MQKKTAFLVCAMAAVMSYGTAHASDVSQHHWPHADTGAFEVKSADGNYRLGFSALLQPRLRYKHWDRSENSQKAANELEFDINRARFGFYGNVFDPALTYLFQAQFDKDTNETGLPPKELGSAKLTDFSVNYAFSQEFFHIAAGKFTVPFARQLVMSPGKLQFADPLGHNRYFGLVPNSEDIRDIGVMFHNGWNNPFEYALAVVTQGVAARLAYNYNHIDGYNAVDLTGGDLRFAIGLSGYLNRNQGSEKPGLMSTSYNLINTSADFILKAHGFATNGVFYYKMDRQNKDAKFENSMGAGIDLGYLIGGHTEPALRYSWYKPHDRHQSHEIIAGLNYYAFGQNLKTQLYGGVTLNPGTQKKLNPIVAGLQLQFAL